MLVTASKPNKKNPLAKVTRLRIRKKTYQEMSDNKLSYLLFQMSGQSHL